MGARRARKGSGFWGRLVTGVMRRPVVMTVLSVAVLLLLASPVLSLRTGITDITAFPDSIDGVAGIKLLNEKWPQGTELQLQVVVTDADQAGHQGRHRTPQDGRPEDRRPERAGRRHAVTRRQGGARRVHDGRQPERRRQSGHRPEGADGADAGRLRRACPTSRRYVTGDAAFSVDVTKVYADGIPLIFGFVLGLSFLLMLVAFHSIVIPIKAILLNLLSVAAAYGVMVLVFERGWLAGPLGITPSGVIESWVPLFIFTILFGLSMDYHLFILTRIKEARDRGLESRAAVAKGISVTAGVITSAASIMVVVFAVFVTLKFVFIQQLGLGLAIAVFIDATIIRSVLLPASMTLLGDWNWWMPRWLDWIPRVTIEGDPDEPVEVGPEVVVPV